MSGLDGTITELDWNIFSENKSDILAIGENALEWDVNGSNVERSGASFGFKYFILAPALRIVAVAEQNSENLISKNLNPKWSYYDASGNFGSIQENYIHSNKRLIKCLDEIDWVYILGDGNLRDVLIKVPPSGLPGLPVEYAIFREQIQRNKYMYKCQSKVIFFNGKSDITLEINGENIITVFIQKSIAILELKEKKFVYFYHTTEESNKQG